MREHIVCRTGDGSSPWAAQQEIHLEEYGARTVAEGVETVADFLAVRAMGFDVAQGFLFSRPVAAKKFIRTVLLRGTKLN